MLDFVLVRINNRGRVGVALNLDSTALRVIEHQSLILMKMEKIVLIHHLRSQFTSLSLNVNGFSKIFVERENILEREREREERINGIGIYILGE